MPPFDKLRMAEGFTLTLDPSPIEEEGLFVILNSIQNLLGDLTSTSKIPRLTLGMTPLTRELEKNANRF